MCMNNFTVRACAALACFYATAIVSTAITTTPIDDTTLNIQLTLAVPDNSYLYREYLAVSVDSPDVSISNWTADNEARSHYDTTFKTTKKIFDRNTTLTLQAHANKPLDHEARIHVTYYLNSNKGIVEESYPLPFPKAQAQASASPQPQDIATHIDIPTAEQPKNVPAAPAHKASYADRLSSLITHTDSLWVRFVLVLLLGLLMSLTPCIYPMIPITLGILQAQGGKSLWRNLLLSLCYTAGIATTFALLGLAAACTGKLFGSFMANPIVIICMVILLAYLGLAMFGLYEMRVPTFLKPRSSSTSSGSYLSAFLFGAASGTVASPCLSPGLVLLLSIVTTLNNAFMGFLLLFAFGVGLSIPLMLIGTFSSSLTMLPRAGMWMIEVKRIFGFMLFGMCFHFLRPLVPAPLLCALGALFLFGAGIFYCILGRHKSFITLHNILGIALIAASIVVGAQAYKAHLQADECIACASWQSSYTKTLETAQHCNRKVFVDVGASFCSLCHAIDEKVLAHPDVVKALEHFCCVKIDGSDDPEDACKLLQEKYGVVGFPTFLLIDASSGQLIKRWGGELYDVPASTFAQELLELAK